MDLCTNKKALGMTLHSIWKFITYWYFRYLMVTEMYMVERWERNVIHSAAVVLFCLFWYFNAKYVISGMSEARGFVSQSFLKLSKS